MKKLAFPNTNIEHFDNYWDSYKTDTAVRTVFFSANLDIFFQRLEFRFRNSKNLDIEAALPKLFEFVKLSE